MAIDSKDYGQLFRTLAVRGVARALTLVKKEKGVPRPPVRNFAIHNLSYGLELPAAWDMVRTLLLLLAPSLERLGYRNDWIGYLEKGILQAHTMGDQETKAKLSFHLGVLYQYQTRYAAARHYLTECATYFIQVNHSYYWGKVLNRLAYVARREGDYLEALRLVEQAEALVGTDAEEQAYSQMVRGTIAFDQRRWETAHSYFVRSLMLWTATQDQWLKAQGLTNLGTTLWALHRYEEAISRYAQAVALFNDIGDPVNRAVAWLNWGNALLHLERFEAAVEHYLRAERTFRPLHDVVRLAALHNNLGMAYQKLHLLDEAALAYEKSIQFWTSIGNIASLINVMDNLSLLYRDQGKIGMAQHILSHACILLERITDHPAYTHLKTMLEGHRSELSILSPS